MGRRILGNRVILLALALLIGVIGARSAFESAARPSYAEDDWDICALDRGLTRYDSLDSTFSWFTGEWIGLNPFWRPLSSYIFWTLNKVVGWDVFEQHARYEILRGLCHVAVTGMLFWLMMVLTGRPLLALLAVFMQNVQIPVPGVNYVCIAPGVSPVARWISMPDLWLAMATLPALWLAWEGRVWWSVPLAAVAAMLKETGFLVFPLVMLFYWWHHRRLHPAFLALIATGALFTTLKLVYVGPGWVLGSNRSMWVRMARFAFPIPVTRMITGGLPWAITGAGVGAAVIVAAGRKSRPRLALGILAVAFVMSVLGYRYTIGGPGGMPQLDVAFAGVIESRLFTEGGYVAVWIMAAWAGLRGPDRGKIVLLAIAHLALGFPATVAPQTGRRSLYTAMLFSSCVSAVCAWSLPVIVGRPVRQEPLFGSDAEKSDGRSTTVSNSGASTSQPQSE